MMQFVIGAITVTLTRVSQGWLMTCMDADSGVTSNLICPGDPLRAKALITGHSLVRMF